MEVEVDLGGGTSQSQGTSLARGSRRRSSLAGPSYARMGGLGSQGAFGLARMSSQAPPVIDDQDEMFEAPPDDLPFDLDDIEVEQLRAAPSAEALGPRNAGDVMAGLMGQGSQSFGRGGGRASMGQPSRAGVLFGAGVGSVPGSAAKSTAGARSPGDRHAPHGSDGAAGSAAPSPGIGGGARSGDHRVAPMTAWAMRHVGIFGGGDVSAEGSAASGAARSGRGGDDDDDGGGGGPIEFELGSSAAPTPVAADAARASPTSAAGPARAPMAVAAEAARASPAPAASGDGGGVGGSGNAGGIGGDGDDGVPCASPAPGATAGDAAAAGSAQQPAGQQQAVAQRQQQPGGDGVQQNLVAGQPQQPGGGGAQQQPGGGGARALTPLTMSPEAPPAGPAAPPGQPRQPGGAAGNGGAPGAAGNRRAPAAGLAGLLPRNVAPAVDGARGSGLLKPAEMRAWQTNRSSFMRPRGAAAAARAPLPPLPPPALLRRGGSQAASAGAGVSVSAATALGAVVAGAGAADPLARLLAAARGGRGATAPRAALESLRAHEGGHYAADVVAMAMAGAPTVSGGASPYGAHGGGGAHASPSTGGPGIAGGFGVRGFGSGGGGSPWGGGTEPPGSAARGTPGSAARDPAPPGCASPRLHSSAADAGDNTDAMDTHDNDAENQGSAGATTPGRGANAAAGGMTPRGSARKRARFDAPGTAGRTPLSEIRQQQAGPAGMSGGGPALSPFEGGLGLGSAARLPRLTQGGMDDELMAPLVMDYELPTQQHSGGDDAGGEADMGTGEGVEGSARRLSSAGSQAIPAAGGSGDASAGAMPSAPGSPWGGGGQATAPWGGRATPATSSGGSGSGSHGCLAAGAGGVLAGVAGAALAALGEGDGSRARAAVLACSQAATGTQGAPSSQGAKARRRGRKSFAAEATTPQHDAAADLTPLTQPVLSLVGQPSSLTQGASRLAAARTFFELLSLKSRGLVALSQVEPYSDVSVCLTQPGASAAAPGLAASQAGQALLASQP
ncbi:hypothetical protein FOA52_016188 [Chlamydomonas sp. UWO 241]|nr:hypothetical protein FOA52_016188 [Chlamydomonas sp. UWO 241]